MNTNINTYDHTTATDYSYGDTTQEYMALMEPTFMWVYPEPEYGDRGEIFGSSWWAVHSFSNNLSQVSNLFSDICIGTDKEVYTFDVRDLEDLSEWYFAVYVREAWNQGAVAEPF